MVQFVSIDFFSSEVSYIENCIINAEIDVNKIELQVDSSFENQKTKLWYKKKYHKINGNLY
jgi:hypothetical protein